MIEYLEDGKTMKKRNTTLDNPKETRRAIRAAVHQANKVDEDLEKYRDADRWEEATRLGRINKYRSVLEK